MYLSSLIPSNLFVPGEGMFTAVGAEDWDNGYGCGGCAELEYQGNVVTVNVVDRWGPVRVSPSCVVLSCHDPVSGVEAAPRAGLTSEVPPGEL